MQESRKAQALSVIAILLVIFTLVLLAIVITVFITKPAFVAGLGFPNTMTSKIVDERNYENYKQEITCIYPYIKVGNECCLDNNNNGICDKNDIGRTRIRSSDIDSTFDINSIDIEKNELSFDLENEGNDDVIIKKIKIDDCDTEHPDKTIEK